MKSGICTITQPSEEISGFVKLVTFMSPLVIIGILSVCFVTYVILASEQGCGNAVLQVIRLIVCVGILRPPKISSTRIFVCMTLFLLLNVNAMFQSRLSSLLTVPIFYKNINTLEDLKVIIYVYDLEILFRIYARDYRTLYTSLGFSTEIRVHRVRFDILARYDQRSRDQGALLAGLVRSLQGTRREFIDRGVLRGLHAREIQDQGGGLA